jgi:hypothetical protein
MLGMVLTTTFGIALAMFGLILIVAAVRLLLGSSDAYETNRRASLPIHRAFLGKLKTGTVENDHLSVRGSAYTIAKDGTIEFVQMAKLSREAVRDTSR